MNNRTKEQLKAMFNQSRLKKERIKQKEKERKRLEQLQLKKAKELMQKTLLKYKLIEEEKERKKQVKIQRTLPLHIYGQMIERDTNEEELYQTVEELREAEERGEGKIQWDVWDKLIEKTQKELKHYEETNSNLRI